MVVLGFSCAVLEGAWLDNNRFHVDDTSLFQQLMFSLHLCRSFCHDFSFSIHPQDMKET